MENIQLYSPSLYRSSHNGNSEMNVRHLPINRSNGTVNHITSSAGLPTESILYCVVMLMLAYSFY